MDYLDYLDEALNEVFEVELALKENLTKSSEKTKKFILKSSMTNKGAEICKLIYLKRISIKYLFNKSSILSSFIRFSDSA